MNWLKVTVVWVALSWCAQSFASKPHIVSLDLCTDWLLMSVASEHDVTLSALSQEYPPPFDSKRDQHAYHYGSLEEIIALAPDMVLVGEYNAWALRSRLAQLGIRVEVLPLPDSLDKIDRQQARLFELLELPLEQVDGTRDDATPSLNGTEVSVLKIGANGIATGRNTFESSLIERAGFTNYIRASGYQTVDLEAVIANPPNRVIFSSPKAPALANLVINHPVWQILVSPEHRWYSDDLEWQCAGPWTFHLLEHLSQWQ